MDEYVSGAWMMEGWRAGLGPVMGHTPVMTPVGPPSSASHYSRHTSVITAPLITPISILGYMHIPQITESQEGINMTNKGPDFKMIRYMDLREREARK